MPAPTEPATELIDGAPADLIGVRGNPLEQFKPLEYPDLVISGACRPRPPLTANGGPDATGPVGGRLAPRLR